MKITAAQYVRYDRRTDVIEPVEVVDAANLAVMSDLPVHIVEPVMGWGEYTHLVSLDDASYYLARME
jgi:hypothetical protein